MQKIWKSINGFEDSYEVSNYGEVRSKGRYVKYKHGGKDRYWPSVPISVYIGSSGYCEVTLKRANVNNHRMVHRLVGEAFLDNPNQCPQINHLDNCKTNNRMDNLEWCTQSHNMRHALDNGFSKAKGASHYAARKIIDTKKKVYYDTLKDAAEAIGLTPTTLCRRLNGITVNDTDLRYL